MAFFQFRAHSTLPRFLRFCFRMRREFLQLPFSQIGPSAFTRRVTNLHVAAVVFVEMI